jgi:hypothetical protein
MGREFSFDVVRSVPNSPQHGPTLRHWSSRTPAKLQIIVNNCRHLCQAQCSRKMCLPRTPTFSYSPSPPGRGRGEGRAEAESALAMHRLPYTDEKTGIEGEGP